MNGILPDGTPIGLKTIFGYTWRYTMLSGADAGLPNKHNKLYIIGAEVSDEQGNPTLTSEAMIDAW